jgi:hypothetical protein
VMASIRLQEPVAPHQHHALLAAQHRPGQQKTESLDQRQHQLRPIVSRASFPFDSLQSLSARTALKDGAPGQTNTYWIANDRTITEDTSMGAVPPVYEANAAAERNQSYLLGPGFSPAVSSSMPRSPVRWWRWPPRRC